MWIINTNRSLHFVDYTSDMICTGLQIFKEHSVIEAVPGIYILSTETYTIPLIDMDFRSRSGRYAM